VFAFRCTQRLLNKLQVPAIADPAAPTTRLGDWYGNVFFPGHHRLMMFVSERSLLPVVMPLRERSQLLGNFRSRLAELLLQLSVSEKAVSLELAQMRDASFARTASASLLGTMNDFIRNARVHIEMDDGLDLLELELRLADTPCGPRVYRYPNKLGRQLLSELDIR